jgi:tetratricopeptide (TPR) repeat protein
MKLAVFKTCFWVLSHLVAHKDTFTIADNLLVNKQYKEAIEMCSSQLGELNTRDTLFEKFLFLRASAYLESNNYSPAIRDYISLTKMNPKRTKYYVGLSYLYGSIGQYENCLNVLKSALEIDPKEIYTLNNLSYYSNQIGNYDAATKYANEGLKYVTEPAWKGALLNNRGYSDIGLKKYIEALDDINQAIKLNPDNSFAYCYRAIANIHLKRMETVCDDLNKAKNLGAITLTEDLIKANCKN